MPDPKVLEAQQWVNDTYGAVAGYQPCGEDGYTGWQTMYALTMGLQHELGISPLAAAFGPTTLSRLTTHGNISTAEDNENIIDIVRYALWCKGYYGGYQQGAWDLTMVDAVRKLRQDIGLPYQSGADLVITPKLFKALLTMDAYVLLAGGSQEAREVQQWMNGRYVGKSTYFLMPCDGHFSRDVQKNLLRAIQYELGIPADQATGTFGDQTKAGLQSHPVSQGSSGIWVQLFSAACVFNGAVEGATTDFTTSFGSGLAAWVTKFQVFSALAANGQGNYATWCQLLVSYGDPDRPVTACDTSRTITAPIAGALHAQGYRYVGRYLANYPGSSNNKMIQPGELAVIFAAGLRVFPIWQMVGQGAHNFTYVIGQEHANSAHVYAEQTHGFDRGTVLYFAVDYDATDAEIESNIVPYFMGVQNKLSALGRRYLAGVYGSRNVCARVSAAAHTRFSFVSGMSYAFSGNLGFPLPPNWSFNQIKELPSWTGGGQTIPLDRTARRPGSDDGAAAVNTGSSPVADVIAYVQELYEIAVDWGPQPNVRVMEYLRSRRYNDWKFNYVIGPIDPLWLEYAEARLPFEGKTYDDPAHGVEIHLDHFAATAQGHYVNGNVGQTDANFGDGGGWGGDLISFYAEWRRSSSEYGSGYDFCMDRMGVIGVNSTFGLGDMIEDADGFFFGKALRDSPGVKFPDLLALYLNAWYADRFTTFVTNRWGNFINLTTSAKKLLTSMTLVPDLVAFREGLIQLTEAGAEPPQLLPNDKIDQFIAGFHDTVVRLAQTA